MSGSIQSGILYPLTQLAFDNSQAGSTVPTKPTLLIGQTLTAQPLAIIAVFSPSQANALFGLGSMLAQMFARYFAIDPLGPIYCLPVPDPSGGAAAAGQITLSLSTPPVGAGTLMLYIDGYAVPVGVAAGDAASAIATKVVAAIAAMPGLPVTAAIGTSSSRVAITAKHLGLLGNGIDLRVNYYGLAAGEVLPANLVVATTIMTGGSGVPTLTAVAGLIGDANYRVIVHPWSDSASMAIFAAMMSFSGGRWSPTRKSWGHVWTARSGPASALATFGPTNNDPHSTVFVYETGSPTAVWEAAAIFAAASAPSLRQQPNQPLQTLQLIGLLPPNASGASGTETAWNATTWQSLLGLGLALARYDSSGNSYILRAPTTYTVNAYGQQDQSYFDTETMYLLMAQSDLLSSTITQKYPRSLVADDGTVFGAGVPVVTPSDIKAEMINIYTVMEELGWVEDADAFIAACTVTRSLINPSEVDILFTPYNVGGLRNVNITNQFRQFSAAVAATVLAA